MAVNFLLSTTFFASHNFWYVVLSFSLISKYFLTSLLFEEDILYDLSLLRLGFFWPKMWSVLENVSCALKKNVYYAVFGCSVLFAFQVELVYILFKSSISLFICFVLSIIEIGILKYPTIIVEFSLPSVLSHFSPYSSVVRCMQVYNCIFLKNWPSYQYIKFFVFSNSVLLKVYFV